MYRLQLNVKFRDRNTTGRFIMAKLNGSRLPICGVLSRLGSPTEVQKLVMLNIFRAATFNLP